MALRQSISVAATRRGSATTQGENSNTSRTDLLVYGCLLALGVLQLCMSRRLEDFYLGDVTYFELARSLIENGFYGFNFKPETTLPPGFPAILSFLCITVSCSYTVFSRSMIIFAILGLMVSYRLLRDLGEHRLVAAAICLLLASSPMMFAFTTNLVFSDMPYFLTSMVTLVLASRLITATTVFRRNSLWWLCALFLVSSLMIRSSGIALLMGILGWLIASWCIERRAASQRTKIFLPLLLIGLLVQGLWMLWAARHEVLQWPTVEGYPRSYVAQLRVKDGNYPELGTASLADVPSRVTRNLDDRAVGLIRLLTRKEYINPSWFSVFVLGTVALVVLGVLSSIARGFGGLVGWYFIGHEAIYLLWPWYGNIRFFLPVAPLACLYLWRGGKYFAWLASHHPRRVGTFILPVSGFLAVGAGVTSWPSGSLQPVLSAMVWLIAFIAAGWMIFTGSNKLTWIFSSCFPRLEWSLTLKTKALAWVRIAGLMIVAAFGLEGVAKQVALGRENLTFDITRQTGYADVLAGQWIAANTPADAVVMARQLDVIYHYSRRKTIWFPPSSDPQLLMEGIRKHGVEFVVVSSRPYSYWLPPEDRCFESLLRFYPAAFQALHNDARFRIFKVVPEYL
jgi:hypothetical protein